VILPFPYPLEPSAWDDQPVSEVRYWLRDTMMEGARCPCCEQSVKVYERSLPLASALVMIALYRATDDPEEFVYLPPILDRMMTGTAHQGGYGTLSHHWKLIEQRPGVRDDGSDRVGWWRLTPLGRDFVRGVATVPRTATLYNDHCIKLDGPQWTIRDALVNKFDYRELMEGTA